MSPKKSASEKTLTAVEQELMAILWKLGEGTVTDVIAQLPKERKLAYTSVSTMMRILETKGIVKARKEGRGHVYIPALSKEVYETHTLQRVLTQVFDDAPVQLMRQFINTVDLTPKQIDEIQKLLKEKGII